MLMYVWILKFNFTYFPSTLMLCFSFHSWLKSFPLLQKNSKTLQLVRSLHRYHRGQGFESRASLNFFQAFFSRLQKLRL